jgi:hypothetical protein
MNYKIYTTKHNNNIRFTPCHHPPEYAKTICHVNERELVGPSITTTRTTTRTTDGRKKKSRTLIQLRFFSFWKSNNNVINYNSLLAGVTDT